MSSILRYKTQSSASLIGQRKSVRKISSIAEDKGGGGSVKGPQDATVDSQQPDTNFGSSQTLTITAPATGAV